MPCRPGPKAPPQHRDIRLTASGLVESAGSDTFEFGGTMSNVYHLDDHRPFAGAEKPTPSAGILRTATLAEVMAMSAADRASYFEDRRTARGKMVKIIQSRRPPPPESNELQLATAILIHSVSWGRNAWHSTWIQRYRVGTLCESRAASKLFVDRNRTQGSTYYETIMPGWHLQFDRRAYMLCEINTRRPFERLISPDFLLPTMTEKEALTMLEAGSSIWRGHQPNRDSVIVQQTKLAAASFTPWERRTAFPGQMHTPGRYARTIVGKDWFFSPVKTEKGFEFDTTAFEKMAAINLAKQARKDTDP